MVEVTQTFLQCELVFFSRNGDAIEFTVQLSTLIFFIIKDTSTRPKRVVISGFKILHAHFVFVPQRLTTNTVSMATTLPMVTKQCMTLATCSNFGTIGKLTI